MGFSFKNIFKIKTGCTGAINPNRDWRIIILLFVIILLLLFVFDFSVYLGSDIDDMFVQINKNDISIERLKVDKINNTLDFYKNKKESFSNLKRGISIDPSI